MTRDQVEFELKQRDFIAAPVTSYVTFWHSPDQELVITTEDDKGQVFIFTSPIVGETNLTPAPIQNDDELREALDGLITDQHGNVI